MSLRRQEEPTAERQRRPGEGSDAGLVAETLPSASLVFAVLIATMLGFGASMAYSHHVASAWMKMRKASRRMQRPPSSTFQPPAAIFFASNSPLSRHFVV